MLCIDSLRGSKVFASRLLVLLAALSLLAASGSAHEWYPRECCGGLDCAQATEIKITPDGVLATVPGLGRTILLPKGLKYRPSPDDAVHVCVDNNADTPTPRIKCIFWPRDRSFPAVSMNIDVKRRQNPQQRWFRARTSPVWSPRWSDGMPSPASNPVSHYSARSRGEVPAQVAEPGAEGRAESRSAQARALQEPRAGNLRDGTARLPFARPITSSARSSSAGG
jgi:hypothetical protein